MHRSHPAAPSALDAVAAGPPLARALQASRAAADAGFDWPDRDAVMDKVREELAELEEALHNGDPDAIHHELGDLLFSLVNLGRFLDRGAGAALDDATTRFVTRFRALEARLRASGHAVSDTSPEDLEAAWQAVKRDLDDDAGVPDR